MEGLRIQRKYLEIGKQFKESFKKGDIVTPTKARRSIGEHKHTVDFVRRALDYNVECGINGVDAAELILRDGSRRGVYIKKMSNIPEACQINIL
ncbi:MAG: hypothetical protein ACE5J2_08000 [Nitrososphaerales archaeon]